MNDTDTQMHRARKPLNKDGKSICAQRGQQKESHPKMRDHKAGK